MALSVTMPAQTNDGNAYSWLSTDLGASAVVSGTKGTFADNTKFRVEGIGFGPAPEIPRYENFAGGVADADVLTTNTIFDVVPAVKATFSSDARSGALSMNTYQDNGASFGGAGGTLDYGEGVTEMFVSYATKIPVGAKFPHSDAANAASPLNDYSVGGTVSNYKIFWQDDGNTTDKNDIVIPTQNKATGGVNSGWEIAGNDLPSKHDFGFDPAFWEFGAWVRIECWMKAGATPEVDAGNLYFSASNSVANVEDTVVNITPVIFSGGNSPFQWSRGNFGFFTRGNTTGDSIETLIDDFYFVKGANASSRIIVGDASTYALCKKSALCTMLDWSNGGTNFIARTADLDLGGPLWIHHVVGENTTVLSVQVSS